MSSAVCEYQGRGAIHEMIESYGDPELDEVPYSDEDSDLDGEPDLDEVPADSEEDLGLEGAPDLDEIPDLEEDSDLDEVPDLEEIPVIEEILVIEEIPVIEGIDEAAVRLNSILSLISTTLIDEYLVGRCTEPSVARV